MPERETSLFGKKRDGISHSPCCSVHENNLHGFLACSVPENHRGGHEVHHQSITIGPIRKTRQGRFPPITAFFDVSHLYRSHPSTSMTDCD
jgi:hypothetical protein